MLLIAIMVPAAGGAQAPGVGGYAGPGPGTVNQTGPQGIAPVQFAPAPQGVPAQGGGFFLPFTGLQLGLMLIGALGVLGLGLALRRASGQPTS